MCVLNVLLGWTWRSGWFWRLWCYCQLLFLSAQDSPFHCTWLLLLWDFPPHSASYAWYNHTTTFILYHYNKEWLMKQPVTGTARQLSWSTGTGKPGDHNHRRLQTDHLRVPAVVSGFAKGELTRSRFRTRSQPAHSL